MSDEDTYIDRRSMLQRVDGEVDILKAMISAFFESYPGQLNKISDSLIAEDFKAAEVAAHSLKGSIQVFFKGPLARLAHETECESREEQKEAALEKLEELKGEFQDCEPLMVELKEYLR